MRVIIDIEIGEKNAYTTNPSPSKISIDVIEASVEESKRIPALVKKLKQIVDESK